jgi:nitric oxide dioxygenase/hemoglobin
VLGADVATEAVLQAWGEAYWALAELLIAKEAETYAAMA